MLPRASVLHCLLVKVVILLLHSSFPCDELSPAAEYLLTEGGLIQNIYDTATSPNPGSSVACSGLRSFNQNLGDAINRAKKAGIPNQKLLAILSADNTWTELEDIIHLYNLKHRPQMQHDFNDSSVVSSIRNDSHGFNDSEEWTDASTKFAEMDATSSAKQAFSGFSSPFEPNMQRFSDFEGQFDDTPDEDEFRKLCSERANSSSCAGISFETSPIKWPGEAEKTSEKASEPPSVVANMAPPKEDDMWADFSSFPTISPTAAANSASSSSSDAWPGSDIHLQGEASDWPLNNSHESKASDPVMVGLAASISHPGDSSEA